MKQLPPSIRRQIFEEWLSGSVSERQLADRFGISKTVVSEIIGDYQDHGALKPVEPVTLQMARELYMVMPVEVAGGFTDRFEALVGASRALLMTPSL